MHHVGACQVQTPVGGDRKVTNPGKNGQIESFSSSGLHFVGEQDGPVERELKEKISSRLRERPNIAAAYLALVRHGNTPHHDVALCLRSTSGPDLDVLNDIARLFRSMFSVETSLDIVFIDAGEEGRLSKVCRPFYRAAP